MNPERVMQLTASSTRGLSGEKIDATIFASFFLNPSGNTSRSLYETFQHLLEIAFFHQSCMILHELIYKKV